MVSLTHCMLTYTRALSVLGKLLLETAAQVTSTPYLNYIRTNKTLIYQVLCEKEVKH